MGCAEGKPTRPNSGLAPNFSPTFRTAIVPAASCYRLSRWAFPSPTDDPSNVESLRSGARSLPSDPEVCPSSGAPKSSASSPTRPPSHDSSVPSCSNRMMSGLSSALVTSHWKASRPRAMIPLSACLSRQTDRSGPNRMSSLPTSSYTTLRGTTGSCNEGDPPRSGSCGPYKIGNRLCVASRFWSLHPAPDRLAAL